MKRTHHTTSPRHTRHGFSLIELLVVIVIIGILMALILPALAGARLRARVVQVSTEISQLDNAIAKFKSVYNIEPPSSLYIPGPNGAWLAADRSRIRSIWPQFDFSTDPTLTMWNGGLNNTSDFHLSGAECLVFFLGGIQQSTAIPPATPTAQDRAVLGFSKNPRFPWSPAGTNREGPFFEFDAARFADVDNDQLIEFRDPLPEQETPYFYLSSQGRSYTMINAGGTGLSEQDDFDVHGGILNVKDFGEIYLKTVTPPLPHRPDGYQIISPGVDQTYGFGGVYTDGETLADKDLNNNTTLDLNELRAVEADNITNFSGGQLKP